MSSGVILQPQYAAQSDAMNWTDTVNAIFGGGVPQSPPAPIEYKPNTPGKSKGDVVKKAQEWTKIEESDLK